MPSIMSLEGPRVSHLNEIRSQLYAATPRSLWQAQATLNGLLDPFRAHPWVFVLTIIGGAWLAGSERGQKLLKKR